MTCDLIPLPAEWKTDVDVPQDRNGRDDKGETTKFM